MASILIRNFIGITPVVSSFEQAENAAQVAEDCRFSMLDVRPWLAPAVLRAAPAVAPSIRTLYRAGKTAGVGPMDYWAAWNADVNVVRAPIASDRYERTFYTGNGAPRYFDNRALSAVSNNPTVSYLAGVPAPTEAIDSLKAAVSGPTTGTAVDRTYFMTFVNDDGEEGPPSPAPRNGSGQITATLSLFPSQSVTLSSLPAAPAGAYRFGASARKRIYRTTTGGVRYVGEVGITATDFVDVLADNQLGGALPSVSWDAPPATLAGLTAMQNGMLAGFVDNEVYFCEPYRPHAWPLKYSRASKAPFVALGAFEQTLVGLTTGAPVIYSGASPAAMSEKVLDGFPFACVSRRSVVGVLGGVAYACPKGYAWIGPGGPKLLTAALFDEKTWASYAPTSIHAYAVGDKIVGFYDTGTVRRGFVIDVTDQRAPFSIINLWADAGYTEREQGLLYLVVGNNIVQWDAGPGSLNSGFKWKSRKFLARGAPALAAARVMAESYPVTLNAYGDGRLLFTRSVQSRKVFKPKIARKPQVLEFEILADKPVNEIQLGSSVAEFK